jgi:hypothetical protein
MSKDMREKTLSNPENKRKFIIAYYRRKMKISSPVGLFLDAF